MLGWRRPLIVLAASSIFLWLGATPVLGAGNPDRQPAGTPPDVVAPLCGAALGDVLAHISINRQFQKTYVSADGTVRLTFQGYVEGVFTAVATGKSVTVNGSGPATLVFFPNGDSLFVLEGHTLVLNPPDQGIFLYTGLVHYDLATGTVSSFTGHRTDICALLR